MTVPPRVFAYGSNLALARIEERVGTVSVIATGRLDGHALRFHKTGRDGSGKADAYATGSAGDVVFGVIYEMSREAKRELDRIEGIGSHYLEKEASIETEEGSLAATVYCACDWRIDPAAVPFDWYLRLVVEGARHHRLPALYVDAIATHPALVDPDRTRAERALRLLKNI